MTDELDKFDAFSIDNERLKAQGYRFNEGLLAQIKHLKKLNIDIVITEFVHREAVKHLAIEIEKSQASVAKALEKARIYLLIQEPELDNASKLLKINKTKEELAEEALKNYYEEIGAKIISFDEYGDIRRLTDSYFENLPPFANKDKKNEFPDAFSLITLENWVKLQNKNLLAVSNDNDWKDFAEESEVITVTDGISEALSKFQNFNLVSLTEEQIKDLIKTNINQLNTNDTVVDFFTNYLDKLDFYVVADSHLHFEYEDKYLAYQDYDINVEDVEDAHFTWISIEEITLTLNVKLDIEAYSTFHFSVWDSIDKEYVGMGSDELATDTSIDIELLLTIDLPSLIEGDIQIIDIGSVSSKGNEINFGWIEPDWRHDEDDY